jgi:hypothetical protein
VALRQVEKIAAVLGSNTLTFCRVRALAGGAFESVPATSKSNPRLALSHGGHI